MIYLPDAGTRRAGDRLSFYLHCEAIAGAPGEDRLLCVYQARRHAKIAQYVRWLQRHALPAEVQQQWQNKGRWN